MCITPRTYWQAGQAGCSGWTSPWRWCVPLALLAGHQLHRLGIIIWETVEHRSTGVRFDRRTTAPAAQLVHDPPARDLKYPGTKGASRRVEAACMPPARREDILHDLFGG